MAEEQKCSLIDPRHRAPAARARTKRKGNAAAATDRERRNNETNRRRRGSADNGLLLLRAPPSHTRGGRLSSSLSPPPPAPTPLLSFCPSLSISSRSSSEASNTPTRTGSFCSITMLRSCARHHKKKTPVDWQGRSAGDRNKQGGGVREGGLSAAASGEREIAGGTESETNEQEADHRVARKPTHARTRACTYTDDRRNKSFLVVRPA